MEFIKLWGVINATMVVLIIDIIVIDCIAGILKTPRLSRSIGSAIMIVCASVSANLIAWLWVLIFR